MHRFILGLVILTTALPLFAGAAPSVPPMAGASLTHAPATALALAALQPKDVNVDINVKKGGGAWWRNPWIVGGGLLVLVLIIALVSRGGGTTIVER